MIPLVAIAAANVVASRQKEAKPCTLSEIAEATAEEYAIPTGRLLGKARQSVHEEARRVAIYLSASCFKIASPEQVAAFFACDVSRIEVPEGDERRRMNRIANRLKNSQEAANSRRENEPIQRQLTFSSSLAEELAEILGGLDDGTSQTSSESLCFVKGMFGRKQDI